MFKVLKYISVLSSRLEYIISSFGMCSGGIGVKVANEQNSLFDITTSLEDSGYPYDS